MLKRVIEQKYIAPSLSSLGLSLCVHVYNNFHFKFFFSFGVDINECQISNPCKNGGQCENTHGSYECKCTPGFTGRNCETGGLKFRPYTFKNRFEWYSNRWPSRFQLIAWIYGEKIARKILQKANELLTYLRIVLARRGTNLLVSSQGRNISGVLRLIPWYEIVGRIYNHRSLFFFSF